MKKQSKKDKVHEHLAAEHKGPHKQSMKARTHESEAMTNKHHLKAKKAHKGK